MTQDTATHPIPRIHRLDEVTINRIAAGEIIHRPANALKELVENSLDAGSTSISVTVKDGGLKLLQIQDNGHGIHKEDLPILCERFTTSKLTQFSDLERIHTFGFRGEALASISHVAHLTVTTRTADSPCAWRLSYRDGTPVSQKGASSCQPKPIAGNMGTLLVIEDLFYNIPTRKFAFKAYHEEYNRILDVLQKYAIRYPHVNFSCKKSGGNSPDLITQWDSTCLDNIRVVYGPSIPRELLEFEIKNEEYAFEAQGHISNANYNMKKLTFILFINGRLVENMQLKKGIDLLYSKYLPKASHPFIYLSLQIKPEHVDVNVHPTKKEVHYLHQEHITNLICAGMDETLANANTSRTFFVQTSITPHVSVLSNANDVQSGLKEERTRRHIDVQRTQPSRELLSTQESADSSLERTIESIPVLDKHMTPVKPTKSYKTPEHKLIRTDSRARTLDSYISPLPVSQKGVIHDIASSRSTLMSSQSVNTVSLKLVAERSPKKSSVAVQQICKEDDNAPEDDEGVQIAKSQKRSRPPSLASNSQSMEIVTEASDTQIDQLQLLESPQLASQCLGTTTLRDYIHVELISVLELREEAHAKQHPELKAILDNYTFIGCVNEVLALIQYKTMMYMVNYQRLSRDYFYQAVLFGFSNFGMIQFEEPLCITELAIIAFDLVGNDGHRRAEEISSLLQEKSALLLEYFSIQIDQQGRLMSLPVLLVDYVPNPDKLPQFILDLAEKVNWNEEKPCFESIAQQLAAFYEVEPQEAIFQDADEASDSPDDVFQSQAEYSRMVQHMLFPAVRQAKFFKPTRALIQATPVSSKDMDVSKTSGPAFVKLADLPDLYKVFERC